MILKKPGRDTFLFLEDGYRIGFTYGLAIYHSLLHLRWGDGATGAWGETIKRCDDDKMP